MVAIKKPLDNVVESSASYFWFDESGILFILNKAKSLHDSIDATENAAITIEMLENKPRLLLIDVTEIKSISREAREIYAKLGSANRVRAVALVTKSTLGRIVGNFFIGFNKPGAPTRLFNDIATAKKWLLSQP